MRIKNWDFAVAILLVLHAQSTDKEIIVHRDYIATIIAPFLNRWQFYDHLLIPIYFTLNLCIFSEFIPLIEG